MEYDPGPLIAWMEDVLVERSATTTSPLALTTTYSPASLYTRSTMRSLTQDLDLATGRYSTSLPSPASSAPTSSNTQRLEESLSSENYGIDRLDEIPGIADETSYITLALDDLYSVLSMKNEDYRIDGEFSNFEHAAEVVLSLTGNPITPDDVMAAQIGIKLGRLKGLPDDPNNESRLDTLKDLAGYAIILYAFSLRAARR